MDLHLTSGTSNGPIPTNQVICARSTASLLNDPSKAVASVVRPSKSGLSQMRLLSTAAAPSVSSFGLTHSAPAFRSPLKSGLFAAKDSAATLQLRLQQQQQQQQQLLHHQQHSQQPPQQQVFLQQQQQPVQHQQHQQQHLLSTQPASHLSDEANVFLNSGAGIRTLLTAQPICVPASKLVDLKRQRDEGSPSSQYALQSYLRNQQKQLQQQQQQQQQRQQQQQQTQQLLQQQQHQQQQQRRAKQLERSDQQAPQPRFASQGRFFEMSENELKRQRKQILHHQQQLQQQQQLQLPQQHQLQQHQHHQQQQRQQPQQQQLQQSRQNHQPRHQNQIQQQQQQRHLQQQRMEQQQQQQQQQQLQQQQQQQQEQRRRQQQLQQQLLLQQQAHHQQQQQPPQPQPPQQQQQLSRPQQSRSSLFSFPPSLDAGSTSKASETLTGSYPNRSLLKRPSWAASPAPPPTLVPAPAPRHSAAGPATKKAADATEEAVAAAAEADDSAEPPLVSSSLKRKAIASPEPSASAAPQSKFNLRFRNMNNLPKYAQKHKHNLYKRMGKHYGCCVDPLQSLDLVRDALQRYINKEVDDLLQRYRTNYFERAIANIRENCGAEAISEDHVTNLFRAILENAKEQYAPSCALAPPQRPSSSLALLGSLAQGSAAASDTTSECGSHLSEPPGHSPARKRRTTSPFSSYKAARRVDDSDGDLSPVSSSAAPVGCPVGVRKRKRGGGRGGGVGRGGLGRNGERPVTPTRYPVSRRCSNIDVEKLTSQTKFVLGSNANVWLGLGQARGRIYSKHSDLFRYNCDSKEEKQWLIDVGHMTSHGVKAKLMLHEEVLRLGNSPDYRHVAGLEVALVDFHLPEWFLRRMRDNLLFQRQQQQQQQQQQHTVRFPKRGRRGRGRAAAAMVVAHHVAPGGGPPLGLLPPSPPSRPASTPANSVDFESEDFGASPSPSPSQEDDASSVECGPARTEEEEEEEEEEDEEEDDDVLRSSRGGGGFGISGRFEPSIPVSPGPPILERYDDDVEEEEEEEDGGAGSPLLEPPMTAGFDVPGSK